MSYKDKKIVIKTETGDGVFVNTLIPIYSISSYNKKPPSISCVRFPLREKDIKLHKAGRLVNISKLKNLKTKKIIDFNKLTDAEKSLFLKKRFLWKGRYYYLIHKGKKLRVDSNKERLRLLNSIKPFIINKKWLVEIKKVKWGEKFYNFPVPKMITIKKENPIYSLLHSGRRNKARNFKKEIRETGRDFRN